MGGVEQHSRNTQDKGAGPLVRYEKRLSVESIGTLWLGRMLAGNDAGRAVLLRQLCRREFTVKELDSIRESALAYGKVRHPAFAKLLGVIEQDSDLITISEHLVGSPLLDVMRQTIDQNAPLPATVAVRIILDSAKATVKAHRLAAEAGIFPTKRLFLPECVFVASFGGTLLKEIGTLTTIANCKTPKTIPDLLVQLAPEEVVGNGSTQGSPEVFSLGVLLWECLANRWLFSHDSEQRALHELSTRTIPSLDTVERFGMRVPEPLVELVNTATTRNPIRRYGSVDQLVTAIEQLPAHFIATEHQVAEALREHAYGTIALFSIDDSQVMTSGTFSEVPQSTVPTLSPAAGDFESAESPTFAQRQHLSSSPAFEDESPSSRQRNEFPPDSPSPRVVPYLGNTQFPPSHLPRIDVASLPSFDEDFEQSRPTAKTAHNRPHRSPSGANHLFNAKYFLPVLTFVVLALALLWLVRTRSSRTDAYHNNYRSNAPNTVQTARDATAINQQSRSTHVTQSLSSTGADESQTATHTTQAEGPPQLVKSDIKRDVTPPKTVSKDSINSSQKSTASSTNSTQTQGTYHPRQIAPYRPKGI